jgi:hypothetical protein
VKSRFQQPAVNDSFYTIEAVTRRPHLGPMEDEMQALIASVQMAKPGAPASGQRAGSPC